MASFQRIVMIIAVVLLIITLLIVGVSIWNNRFKNIYMPVLPGCPSGFTKVSTETPMYNASPPVTVSSAEACKNSHTSEQPTYVPYFTKDSTANRCAALACAESTSAPFGWNGISGILTIKNDCSGNSYTCPSQNPPSTPSS